jgi:hypothetical protein
LRAASLSAPVPGITADGTVVLDTDTGIAAAMAIAVATAIAVESAVAAYITAADITPMAVVSRTATPVAVTLAATADTWVDSQAEATQVASAVAADSTAVAAAVSTAAAAVDSMAAVADIAKLFPLA